MLDDDGRPVELAAGRRRALLVILLLHANEVVSNDRLIDALWGAQPPETVGKALQGHVSALRKALGADRVETREPGYLLRVGPEELDARRFERLATADPSAALELWRGPALPEFAYADFARAEIERLEELRLGCIEARIDGELDQGRHRELVPELERLVAEHPLRERFRAQLMLALYRSGRQADALAAYRTARASLVDDLGIEPGAELRELEQAILRQDPAIAAPRNGGLRRGSRRRTSLLVAATAVLIAGVAAGLLAALGRGSGPTVVPNSVVEINPQTNGVRNVIRLGRRPDRILAAGDAVFVASPLTGAVTRIDARTRETRTISGLAEPVALAVIGDRLWIGGVHSETLSRFHARTLRRVDRVRVGGVATPWLATGARSVWAVLPHPLVPAEEQVLRLDPESGLVQRRFRTGALPSQVAFGGGAAWVSNFGNGTVSRIDARTGEVASFRVEGVGGLAYAYGALWILTSRPTNSVRRVDPVTLLTNAIVPVGNCPWEIAAGAGAIWTTNCNDGTVTRIDPRTNAVAATIDLGHRPLSVSVGRDAVWVGIAAGPARV